MNALQNRLQAEGISTAIKIATGKDPVVKFYPDGHAEIFFDSKDVKFLQDYIDKIMSAKPSTDVRVHALPIILPALLKKAAPLIIGLFVAGYLTRMVTSK
jgi:hypothetical protein